MDQQIAETVLSEPGVADASHYARRVKWLALIYFAMPLLCVTGIALLIWRGKFFVTLTQRSNVETLTIAFFILFFAYFAFVTAPGAFGALRIARFRLHGRNAQRKQAAALGKRGHGTAAAFDKAVVLAGHRTWEVEIRDEIGLMGRLCFDGVRVELVDTYRGGSNTLLGYVAHRLSELIGETVTIVHWASTHEEKYLEYVSGSHALIALGRKLETDTWPTVTVTHEQRDELERELGRLCPPLRDEAFLPDWEYEGEHKLPIIPEPLGIITLSRSERRVDPLSTMSAALTIIAIVVALISYFLARPPWIPGH